MIFVGDLMAFELRIFMSAVVPRSVAPGLLVDPYFHNWYRTKSAYSRIANPYSLELGQTSVVVEE